MGLIRSTFSFTLGTLVGVYVAQNYNVPNVQKMVSMGMVMVRQLEEAYRKPDNSRNSKPPE
ncbi:hypothetical protein O6H91_03G023000 [Diphasiastrum complanatum]|uniref:Uncharacterized protein n=1 Tax=Diphasiastrum complanatum TaxID=34168 RepID=A0ACC2E499_DIPCM|nr:hypothetical protein O6H91_03G023000 [Diphasiastrum complanatum]